VCKTLSIVNTLTLKPFDNPKPFGGKEFSLSKESQTYFFLCPPSMHILRDKKKLMLKNKKYLSNTHATNKPGDKLDLYLSVSHGLLNFN
jgi:hypothetical protein